MDNKVPEGGGVLGKGEIFAYMEKPDIKERLIITPLIDYEDSIDECSIDVRLGNEFIVMRKQTFPILNVADQENLKTDIGRYQEEIRINFHEQFILHPRQLIIGSTFEYVKMPTDLMCYVSGKSTWGRMGLIVATATKVDPGFKGCITLEIINEGEVPIVLYPGMPIGQIVLHKTLGEYTYDGSYDCPTGPQFPSVIEKKQKLDVLVF
ncbi:MAG: Deoxycytidine triphosphate deaminase [Candidatus Scalindua rubra]|uniref:Deoxycytidine triphosphate deaminase n=1 Tax=Candidatus Scalindua rubra TaxID=1872076 RepID=A0A1E3X374_9BACT|nr:MAG: Deoxycytidine triphosphate deaminase [Candidatus Scalindua rubra]